jgi:hypothetical protein
MAEQLDSALTERLAGLSEDDLMALANEVVDEVRRSRAVSGGKKSVAVSEDSDLPHEDSPGDVLRNRSSSTHEHGES